MMRDMALAEKFIPENIFNTLNNGQSLKIVIFCLIFGVALGHLQTEGQRMLVEVLKSIQQASISIFKFLNYFLPIALLAMISAQVGKVGVGIFLKPIFDDSSFDQLQIRQVSRRRFFKTATISETSTRILENVSNQDFISSPNSEAISHSAVFSAPARHLDLQPL